MTDVPKSDLPLPTFPAGAAVCGNCKLWQAHSVEERGWVGPCRILPERGLFPPSAPSCNKFVARGSAVTALPPDATKRARVVRSVAPLIKRKSAPVDPNQVVDLDLGGELNMTREELMDIFREAAGDVAEPPPLAQKWSGGVVQLVPANRELQAKELPIDSLFHKVVMARDRLRTLEQKINGHPKLSDAEKVEMQAYITRIYGSLTSFNLLFREKSDYFVGQKSDE